MEKSIFEMMPNASSENTKKWNSGFMFKKGFDTSKMFQRYCTKMQNIITDFLYEEVSLREDKSVVGRENLFNITRSFFRSLYTLAGMSDYLPENAMDWRFNLIPMLHACPYNLMKASDAMASALHFCINDDTVWQNLAKDAFSETVIQFLHIMFIRYPNVDAGTFVTQGTPRCNSEKMEFTKLYFNMVWIRMYEATREAVIARKDGALDSSIVQNQIKKLECRLKSLQQQLTTQTEDSERTEDAYKQQIREMKESQAYEVNQQVRAYKDEFASKLSDARKEAKNALKELEKAKARIAELEEAAKIEELASDDTEEHAPENTLDYNSKIVFVVSPPSNGRVERTFEKLRQRFPNSVFVHHADDCTPNADCYVFLTKYILHHSLYNAARDMCARRGWAYIHSANQNVDIIAQDIFGRTRYMQSAKVSGAH